MPILLKIDGIDSISSTDSLDPRSDRGTEPVKHDPDAFSCSELVQWAAAIDLAWTDLEASEGAGLPDRRGDVGMIRPGNYQVVVGSPASGPGESIAEGILPAIQHLYDFIV
jgi:hypothetical protein